MDEYEERISELEYKIQLLEKQNDNLKIETDNLYELFNCKNEKHEKEEKSDKEDEETTENNVKNNYNIICHKVVIKK